MMTSEYFNEDFSVFGQIENLWMDKTALRHLHHIQGDWAGRNFITASRVASGHIAHPRMQRWIWNPQLPMDSTCH